MRTILDTDNQRHAHEQKTSNYSIITIALRIHTLIIQTNFIFIAILSPTAAIRLAQKITLKQIIVSQTNLIYATTICIWE